MKSILSSMVHRPLSSLGRGWRFVENRFDDRFKGGALACAYNLLADAAIAVNEGISARQGRHQVAQKLSITTRPRSSFSRKGFPSSVCNSSSGAEGKADRVGGGWGAGAASAPPP